MICLRRIMPEIDFAAAKIPYDALMKLEVHMADFTEALREVEPSAIREVFVEIPEVHWEDVGGLEKVKEQLVEAVEWPLEAPGPLPARRRQAAEGHPALRPARLRQDAAGQGRGAREPGQLHLGEGAGAALDVRRRIGEGRPRGLPQGAAGGGVHPVLRRD